ncbi:site-specific integrase [Spirosoma harenae]
MAQSTDHKEARASVRIVYRTYDLQKDGTCPFFICITKQRKRKYIATGLTLAPKYWDESKQSIRRNYPDHLKRDLQSRLNELVERYETAAKSLAETDEQHDAATVASKAVESRKQTRKTTLLAYIDTIVHGLVIARKTGNSIVYKDLRNQLAKFIKDEYNTQDIPFDKVNVSFCSEWENTLRAGGAADNTLSNRFRTLRAVLNRAIANGFAKPDSYPFARTVADKHKFSIGKFDTSTQKRAISREEVRKVENYTPTAIYAIEDFKGIRNPGAVAKIKNATEIQGLTFAKNVFLFSFYVGGINFVDLAKLRWRNLSTDAEGNIRLSYIRQKTRGRFSLKLLPTAIDIIEQYRPETYIGPDSYIFPILNSDQHKIETQINNRLHKVLGQVNKNLKIIGERLRISAPLTTYVARHSFATSLKQSGVAAAIIGQAMGHKTEAVTAIYLDSFSSDIIDDAYNSLI